MAPGKSFVDEEGNSWHVLSIIERVEPTCRWGRPYARLSVAEPKGSTDPIGVYQVYLPGEDEWGDLG